MKACPEDKSCFAFETMEEFNQAFAKFAERQGEELNDDLCIDGNSGLTFGGVKEWADYFGVENVYFGGVDGEFDYISEFYFDLKNAKHNRLAYIGNPDEVSFHNGFLRIWYE